MRTTLPRISHRLLNHNILYYLQLLWTTECKPIYRPQPKIKTRFNFWVLYTTKKHFSHFPTTSICARPFQWPAKPHPTSPLSRFSIKRHLLRMLLSWIFSPRQTLKIISTDKLKWTSMTSTTDALICSPSKKINLPTSVSMTKKTSFVQRASMTTHATWNATTVSQAATRHLLQAFPLKNCHQNKLNWMISHINQTVRILIINPN